MRIGSNMVASVAQRNLIAAGTLLSTSLERLSTGMRINRASDDPAGLMASERLRSEIMSLETSIDNATRATNMLGTAEGGIAEINTLLLEVQGYVADVAGGGLTEDEIASKQLMLDEALDSIDRIAATTSFNGRNLLDGTAGYPTSGVDPAELSSVTITEATFTGASQTVTYEIYANTASKGEVTMAMADIGLAEGNVTVTGNRGSATLSLTAGMSQAQLMQAVNSVSDQTGVEAFADGGDVDFRSSQYGASQYVQFSRAAGATFSTDFDADYGSNATVVHVGGSAEGVSVEGLNVSVNRQGLEVDMSITDTTVMQAAGSFDVGAGGLAFLIGGTLNGSAGAVSVGIPAMGSDYLGTATGGYLSSLRSGGINDLSTGNATEAAAIVETSISQAAAQRGRMGAIQHNTMNASIRAMGSTLLQLESAQSEIRDADYAAEVANLVGAQILMQSSLAALAHAGIAQQSVLSLLEG